MGWLSRSDMEDALRFAAAAAAASASGANRAWVIDHLVGLVPGDGHFYAIVHTPTSALLYDIASVIAPPDRDRSRLEELLASDSPYCSHFTRSPGGGVVGLTEITSPTAFMRSELGALLGWSPRRYAVQLRVPVGPDVHATIDVDREHRDFSPRDRLLLAVLRPHLAAYEGALALRRALEAYRGAAWSTDAERRLTPREREILDLVAEGETNTSVARRLRISPDTVRKHLENIFAKLEVRTRTAALARTGRAGPGRGA